MPTVTPNEHPLRLFNTRGRRLEEFIPLNPPAVGLYTCGLTVYNYAHLGNLRAYVFADFLRRTLEWKGYDVTHVMNITDVGHLTDDADEGDDKMEQAAAGQKRNVWEIAEYYTECFKRDLVSLNILFPTVWCKATDHIAEQIADARILEEKGFTYLTDSGLYFDTSKLPTYGDFAGLDLAGQKAGARVDASGKRNPSDFAIWRFSPTDKQRLMEWDSPWGVGAPGWHLECSTMSMKYLGRHFDIHTGGVDHIPVHHTNEIAQAEGILGDGEPWVRYWLHNEFLLFKDAKMSKSTGQFLRLESLAQEGIHPLVYRAFLLGGHYRSQVAFSLEGVCAAETGLGRLLDRLCQALERTGRPAWAERLVGEITPDGDSEPGLIGALRRQIAPTLSEKARPWADRFDEALSDDLNAPKAVGVLYSAAADPELPDTDLIALVGLFDLVLGLRLLEVKRDDLNLRPAQTTIDAAEIERLLGERNAARARKDWAAADALRARLEAAGVLLCDGKGGTTWMWK